MLVRKIEDLQKENLFTEKKELFGKTTFEEFEKSHDEEIFYADGYAGSVMRAMAEEFHVAPFNCVEFDGWFIALKY